MGCLINIQFTTNIDILYCLGLSEAIAHGGQLSGNSTNGTFSIPALGAIFEGRYKVNNNVIQVELLKKPFFIPCKVIEGFLKSHIT